MDKKIVTCIAATTNSNSSDIAFTYNNLSTFCKDLQDSKIYIYDNFSTESTDIVGQVLYGFIHNNKLVIICSVYKELLPCYIVPGFDAIDTEHNKYMEVVLKCMGATLTPTDYEVTVFKELEW